jgi:hypothetical protein
MERRAGVSVRLALLITAILSAAAANPASAAEVRLRKQSVDQLKVTCQKVGGSFSQDSGGYACGTDCRGNAGTDCTVFCKNAAGCTAQVIGGRRPRTVEQALQPKNGGAR